MKKRFITSALCTLLCLVSSYHTVHAEESKVDTKKWITLTVKQGEKIKLAFAASSADVWVKVTGVKVEKEVQAPTVLNDIQSQYEATGTEIKVYGAIVAFSCRVNPTLTALDVSNNDVLEHLNCSDNQLSSLDVSKNLNLKYLSCMTVGLSNLDVSKNVKLTELYCHQNQLSDLDLSKNVNLEILTCGNNSLSSLDLSKNAKLVGLYCINNQLSSLDVSKNVKLTELYCHHNQLSNLDVSNNEDMKRLNCSYNKLSDLDLSKNVNLEILTCVHNSLSSLDLSKNVKLVELYCVDNQLSNLNVGKNEHLVKLICSFNKLSNLDVSQNGAMKILNCTDNKLSSLDVGQNMNLETLYCFRNHLSSLDVSSNIQLKYLLCYENQLSSLDVSKNKNLEGLTIFGNNFSTSVLNNIYCQLPDRTGQSEKGSLYLVDKKGDIEDEFLVKSTSKEIADGKNWEIQYFNEREDIEDITGKHTCGSTYGLTLEPATIANSFSYQGGEWKTTVTSSGNWKVDETAPLPEWLSVDPKQGVSGTQVTITVKPNATIETRRTALTFVLAEDATTKQVVILSQNPKPQLLVTPSEGYTFPAAGETKEDFFEVESLGAWEVTSSNAAWFPVETKSGEAGKTKVTIQADANSNLEERETELTFALKDNKSVKQVVALKQKGQPAAVESQLLAGISVAPNPFSSTLRISNKTALNAHYELVNMNGVREFQGVLDGSETVLNTEKLKAGMYLLRIHSDNGSRTLHVVKE